MSTNNTKQLKELLKNLTGCYNTLNVSATSNSLSLSLRCGYVSDQLKIEIERVKMMIEDQEDE